MPWFADLQARVAQLQEWTANFEVRAAAVLPYSMWLPGMFNQVRWRQWRRRHAASKLCCCRR